MTGGTVSKIKVTLRDPLNKDDQISYYIVPDDTNIGNAWVTALKELLKSGNLLEKNYCFMGFPKTARTLEYLCNEMNTAVHTINMFNTTQIWQRSGLPAYYIEEHFTPDTVRYSAAYPLSIGPEEIGLQVKHGIMNRIHNHFERMQGTVWALSSYYKYANYETKYAIRQLNNICHEIESLCLSQRKQATAPEWVRPSQITTFLHATRYPLTTDLKAGFATNGYDKRFGHVYMHWAQIGKTLFEVFRDEGAPKLNVGADPTDISVGSGATCEAINSLKFYSGEFDIDWGNDVVMGGKFHWHDAEQNKFKEWIAANGLEFTNPDLCLGYLPIGKVALEESFGTTDSAAIWDMLSGHLDIYKIEVDDVVGVFDYCWSDPDYKQSQIDMMKPGYDYSSRR